MLTRERYYKSTDMDSGVHGISAQYNPASLTQGPDRALREHDYARTAWLRAHGPVIAGVAAARRHAGQAGHNVEKVLRRVPADRDDLRKKTNSDMVSC